MRLLVALFLLPSVCASADLTASGFTHSGEGTWEGPLLSFATDPREQGLGAPIAAFTLSAGSVTGRVEWTRFPLQAGGVGVLPRDSGTTPIDLADVLLSVKRSGQDSYAWLGGVPGAGASMRIIAPGASGHSDVAPQARAFFPPSQAPPARPAGDAVALSPISGHLLVEGTFDLVIWDLDLVVAGRHAAADIWTGERSEPSEPDAGGLTSSRTLQQAFLRVQDGVFRMSLDASWSPLAAWPATSLAGSGELVLYDVLAGLEAPPTGRRDVIVGGELAVGLAPVADRIGLSLPTDDEPLGAVLDVARVPVIGVFAALGAFVLTCFGALLGARRAYASRWWRLTLTLAALARPLPWWRLERDLMSAEALQRLGYTHACLRLRDRIAPRLLRHRLHRAAIFNAERRAAALDRLRS